jgi:uncharacterized RDD family membrane protein YckC
MEASAATVEQSGALPDGVVLSSSGKRLGSLLLDGVLLIVTLFIGWLIWSIRLWSKGQTPAKKLMGMRTLSTVDYRSATTGTMALRELVVKSVINSVTFGIGAIWLLWDKDRQNLYDKVLNTIVVDDPEGLTLREAAG